MKRSLLLLEPDPWRAASLTAFLAREGWDVRVPGQGPGRGHPEIVLVNLAEAPGEFRAKVEELRRADPRFRAVAFLREVSAATVFPCLSLGVKGVLPFDASEKELRSALLCVVEGSIWTPRAVLSEWIERIASLGLPLAGGIGFTRSERRVLDGVSEELPNKEIARRLGISEATVKFHVGRLLRKTGTTSRRELARFIRGAGVGEPGPLPEPRD